METPIIFKADDLSIEGLLHRVPGDRGVIVTHPHSQYGGSMHNPVVEEIIRVYGKNGYSTLRFNFRGVGSSEGSFENGCGEARDVLGAIDYLIAAGIGTIHLAGYSFGSRVLAGITEIPAQVKEQVYVSPPVAFMDFSSVGPINKLRLVITGGNDDIAPSGEIQQQLRTWNPEAKLSIIKDCDHFYTSSLNQLANCLTAMFN